MSITLSHIFPYMTSLIPKFVYKLSKNILKTESFLSYSATLKQKSCFFIEYTSLLCLQFLVLLDVLKFSFGEKAILCTTYSFRISMFLSLLKILKIYIGIRFAFAVFITSNICNLLISCWWWWSWVFASILGKVYGFWYMWRYCTSN